MDNWKLLYLFKYADSDRVFNLLKKLRKKKCDYLDEEAVKREEVAFQRNDPVINLGLALYGSSPSVGRNLFKIKEAELKIACVSGTLLLPSRVTGEGFAMDLLPSILKENNKDVISAYFSNKHLPEEILKSLYKRKTPFNEFSDENWVSLCFYTANNPRITTPPESELFPDNALDYMRVINLAWKLFEIFPVSYHSADVLFHLAKNLVPPRFVNIDFELIINRWQGESSEKEDEFFYARYAYANHIQDYDSLFKSLKESDDLALRCAYYRNKSYSKVEDILNDATKDGSKFLDEVFGNRHIFQSETTRNALHSAVKNIGELAPNEAGWYMGEHWRALSFWEKKYPEWFEDGVGDAGLQSFNTVMSKTKRTEKQIGYLTSAIKKIDKKLSVELDDSESLIGIGEYCERKFETINQALQKMNQKLNSGATFFIFGLVIGHFIFS